MRTSRSAQLLSETGARFSLVASVLVVGCEGFVLDGQDDAGLRVPDAGVIDAGRGDSGAELDAGSADGGLDAGAAHDSGSPDASVGVGCQGRDYLLCEDFEDATPGSLPTGWTLSVGWQGEDARPEVTAELARTGRHSLRSATAIVGQHRIVRNIEDLGDARGVHWGRVFYRVEAPAYVPRSGVIHTTFVTLLGRGEARLVDTVLSSAGDHLFIYNIPGDSCCAGSRYDYHTFDDAWHCAEWQVDRTTQSYRFFIDGDEVREIAFSFGAGTDHANLDDFSRIELGWRNYQGPEVPYVSHLDDLAIDDARIG